MGLWKVDQAHSEIKFKVRHLVVSTVTGHFGTFNGIVEMQDNNFASAKITFEADVNSINTKNEQRDNHLKSPDFFDAGNYPKLKFVSSAIEQKTNSEYQLIGDLTIRGITKRVVLNVRFNGIVKGFGGTEIAGFEISGSINRFDFHLQWNALTESGGIVVSEDVSLDIAVELQKLESMQKAA